MKTHSYLPVSLWALVLWVVALGFATNAAARVPVDVVWNANPEFDIAGYRVYMGTSPANLAVVETVTTGTGVRLQGLQPGTTYHFAVQAFNTAGLSSELSTLKSFTTNPEVVIPSPQIAIQRADGSVLENHSSRIDLGSAVSGTSGSWETFTITNLGNADLTNLSISLGGSHADDFQLSTTGTVSLAPGASTLFEIAFKPSAQGNREALVSVASNDPNQSPFVLAVAGEGTATPILTEPAISIQQADGFHLSQLSPLPFGSLDLGPSSLAQILTIGNSGTADLSDLSASISGNHVADFKISALGTSTLSPGQTTSLTVTFKPLAIGARQAQLRILSNDADNSPFQIALSGTGVGHPEITITQASGGVLNSGSATQAFGAVDLGSASAAQTLTITNTGTANLSGLAGSLVGSNIGDFILTGPANAVLAPGASTTVSVAFRPTGAGSRIAKLQIASNDADENPFEINLSGSGVAHPEIVIDKSDGSSLTTGSASLAFGSLGLGGSGAFQTLTIRNTGTGNLSGLGVVVEGSHAADFTVGGPALQTLSPGASTTLTVTFNPGSAGSRSASLRVASNDADENPFVIQLSGIGVAAPEIAVTKSDASSLVDGGAGLAFGSLNLSAAGVSQTLTIRNVGTANLTGILASIDGNHAADFKITGTPASSVAPGGSTSVTVVFKPLAIGSRSAFLRIASNDADESPFDISLGGSGFGLPVIALQKSDLSPLANGGAAGFGNLDLGPATTSQTFTIRNLGNGDLTGLALSMTGNQTADFSHSTLSSQVIAPGGSLAFTVTFKPLAAGQRTAFLRIASNDTSANPFQIALSGTGIANPEIDVEFQNSDKLASGTSSLAFGIGNLGIPGIPQTLTIRNTGSGNLTGIVPSLTGPSASEFILSGPGTSVLAPGASTTLSVTFRPVAAGFRSATLLIASNDADENPFFIAMGGSGFSMPEIDVLKSDQSPLMAGGTLIFDTVAPGTAAATQTFTIRNSGTAELTGLSLSLTGSHADEFTTSALAAPTLPPGGTQSFTLRFSPLSGGTRSARLRITSNDSKKRNFDTFIFGTGSTTPNIAIEKAGGVSLPTRAGRLDFGPSNLGSTVAAQTLIIRNQGNGNLNLGSIEVSGPHSADFFAAAPSVNIVTPGASALVAVTFKPIATGTRSAVIRIASNDPDTGFYEIQLGGSGMPPPQISVGSQTIPNLASGVSIVAFPTTNTGSSGTTQTFTIRNTGGADLIGLLPQIAGVHASGFSVLSAPAPRITPGSSSTLVISFKPTIPGRHQATLGISANDASLPVFVIPLIGQAIAQPEISLFAGALSEFPHATGNVEFGSVKVGDAGITRTFTIRNTGSAPLQRLKLGRLVIGRSAFSIGKMQKSMLSPGESVSFTVTFRPKKAGKELGELKILSTDADENPYILKFSGTGTIKLSGGAKSPSKPGAGKAGKGSKGVKKSAMAPFALPSQSAAEAPPRPVISIVRFEGRKYRCITLHKSRFPGITPRRIEVSPDLLKWSSGARHTTVLVDTPDLLKVRDNTPMTAGSKRFIRIRETAARGAVR